MMNNVLRFYESQYAQLIADIIPASTCTMHVTFCSTYVATTILGAYVVTILSP